MNEHSRSVRTGFLIHEVSRLRRTVFDQAMRPHGITRAQWWILSGLTGSKPEGMTQSELAKLLGLSRVALGDFVDRLEAMGYLKRTPDDKDRRVNRLTLTPAGKRVVRKMQSVGTSIEEKTQSGLSEEEHDALERLLSKLKQNLLSLDGMA